MTTLHFLHDVRDSLPCGATEQVRVLARPDGRLEFLHGEACWVDHLGASGISIVYADDDAEQLEFLAAGMLEQMHESTGV